MAQVYLGLGCNRDTPARLQAGLTALAQRFGTLNLSPVYESEPVGCGGGNFLNMVVGLNTALEPPELQKILRNIERANGRRRTNLGSSARTLDIDILAMGNRVGSFDGVCLPRPDITQHAFVLRPFSELAPNYLHPLEQQTLAQLWACFDRCGQKLWPVDFSWQGQRISSTG